MNKASDKTTSRPKRFRYRTLAPTSQVDETLFGSPRPKPPNTLGNSVDNKSTKYQKGETIQIITSDLIRNLRIRNDPSDSINLPSAEFKRITSVSQGKAKEEIQALKEASRRKKEEEMKAAEDRKRRIYEIDLCRKENHALTKLELEAKGRAQHLLERANFLKMEEEDEIKNLNKIILNVRCQAIRDAQIQEKKQIRAALSEEERRLDTMMEVKNLKDLETEAQIEELCRKQRISGKQQICHQIQERLEEKQIQDVTKELERQNMEKRQEQMRLEDLKALEKKRQEQQHLQINVMQMKAEAMQAKEKRREEEKLADFTIMKYNQKKLEQEAKYEAEKSCMKREKESVIARLRAQQETAKDRIAEQNESRIRRIQEITDREWRRKQKELAVKKAHDDAVLRAARLEQVRCKEHFLSLEAGRKKAEYERVLKAQQEAIIKQKEMEEKQRQKALRHAETVQQQIRERQLSAIAKRRDFSKEAEHLTTEEHQRLVRLNEIKDKKLKELKSTGVSEKYFREAERKARDCIQSPQCEKQPTRSKGTSESHLRPTCLPPISRPTKASFSNLQRASAASSNTRLPPIRDAVRQRSKNQWYGPA